MPHDRSDSLVRINTFNLNPEEIFGNLSICFSPNIPMNDEAMLELSDYEGVNYCALVLA